MKKQQLRKIKIGIPQMKSLLRNEKKHAKRLIQPAKKIQSQTNRNNKERIR